MEGNKIQVGDTVKILADVKSHGKGQRVYAKAGEIGKVKSISHLPVLLVEGKTEVYAVRIENVVIIIQ